MENYLKTTQLCSNYKGGIPPHPSPSPFLECESDRNGTDFSCPLPTCPLSLDLSIFWLRSLLPGNYCDSNGSFLLQ